MGLAHGKTVVMKREQILEQAEELGCALRALGGGYDIPFGIEVMERLTGRKFNTKNRERENVIPRYLVAYYYYNHGVNLLELTKYMPVQRPTLIYGVKKIGFMLKSNLKCDQYYIDLYNTFEKIMK